MRKIIFPPVASATEDGLVAIGGDLQPDTLIEAYRNGIFPWPISVEFPLAWFSPDPRGILIFEELHLPGSFKKFLKKNPFQISFNQNFLEVINHCATVQRNGQTSTWITPDIIKAYELLFHMGLAYSVEVKRENRLVGGIYGVIMGNYVSGESMFKLENNASKTGLYFLIQHLKNKDIHWFDTQMITEVVSQLGGRYIHRSIFLEMIKKIDWSLKRSDVF